MLVITILPLLPFCFIIDLFIAFFRVALVERATRKKYMIINIEILGRRRCGRFIVNIDINRSKIACNAYHFFLLELISLFSLSKKYHLH